MQLEILNQIGQCKKVKAPIKTWRNQAGNFDAVAHAAHYYAKRDKRRMVIVPGNSYGRRVYHIATDDKDARGCG